MTSLSSRPLACLLLGASIFFLASCGGGGGGTASAPAPAPAPTPSPPPPPPPPPPAPSNAAPSVTVKADDAAPQEGQYFTLDASATTDADNDPLTFTWVQTAGPAVDIPDDTVVPELTETETATFELTVDDGTDTTVESVDITFTNIYQMPRFAGELPLVAEIEMNGSVESFFSNAFWGSPGFLGIAAESGEDISLYELTVSFVGSLVTAALSPVIDDFVQPVRFKSTNFTSFGTGTQFFVIEETLNRLRGFAQKNGNPIFTHRYRDYVAICQTEAWDD